MTGSLLAVDAGAHVDSSLELEVCVHMPSVGGVAAAPAKRTSMIIVVDRSGSMGSYLRSQCVPALLYVAEQAYAAG